MPDNSQTQLTVSDSDLRRAGQITRMVDLLSMGKGIEEACDIVSISTETWRRWRKAGQVQNLLDLRFKDITTGMRGLIADSLVNSTKVLAQMAEGKLPTGTNIKGSLAPTDVIAANKELRGLWQLLGGDSESQAREEDRLIEELKAGGVSITTVNIQTMNVGSEHQPMPIPSGIVVEGEVVE